MPIVFWEEDDDEVLVKYEILNLNLLIFLKNPILFNKSTLYK